MERGREREEAWGCDGASEGQRAGGHASEENKENVLVSPERKDDLLMYQDEEALNDSIISGERAPRGGVVGEAGRVTGPSPPATTGSGAVRAGSGRRAPAPLNLFYFACYVSCVFEQKT